MEEGGALEGVSRRLRKGAGGGRGGDLFWSLEFRL